MFLSDEDRGDLPLDSRHNSGWVNSWEAALAHLDKYPWHSLYPMVVHREFQERVWAAVQMRFQLDKSEGRPSDRGLERWHELCGGPLQGQLFP